MATTNALPTSNKHTILTARFWVWHHDGFVRISLRDGDSLTACDSRATDEGYSATVTTWSRDGDTIISEWSSRGRDCDGDHGYDSTVTCNIAELAVNDQFADGDEFGQPILQTPNWQKENARQYDRNAELAGY